MYVITRRKCLNENLKGRAVPKKTGTDEKPTNQKAKVNLKEMAPPKRFDFVSSGIQHIRAAN